MYVQSGAPPPRPLPGPTVLTRLLVATWACAFIIANVIPFFSSLLSLMSSLFDSFFGFIFWGIAYFRMRKADGVVAPAARRWAEGGLNIVSTHIRHGTERNSRACCPFSRWPTCSNASC